MLCCKRATGRAFICPCEKGSGKTCIFTPELRASKSIDPCAVHRPYFEAGQLEVDGTCASTGAFEMKTFFKVVIWIAAASVGPSLLKSRSSASYRTNSWSSAAAWNSWIARLRRSCGMRLSSVAFDDESGQRFQRHGDGW
jgi:hypothetical protein